MSDTDAGTDTGQTTTTTDTTTTDAGQTTATLSPRETFLASLPEQYRTDPSFGNFNSWEDVAKSYSNASKMVGMDKNQIVALPKEPTPEAMAPIWDKLGRPTEVKGYEIEQFKETLPPEMLGKYAEIAHKNGISKAGFNSIIAEFVNESKAAHQSAAQQEEQQVSEWQNEVKKEYGAAYDQKIAFAQKAVENFGLTEIVKSNPAFFEHPALIKALVTIGEKTSEGLVLGNGDVSHGKLAPNEAKMEIARFNSDPAIVKILMDKTHPQHEFMMKKRTDLFKYAYPE